VTARAQKVFLVRYCLFVARSDKERVTKKRPTEISSPLFFYSADQTNRSKKIELSHRAEPIGKNEADQPAQMQIEPSACRITVEAATVD
jgi:hypothetical protein